MTNRRHRVSKSAATATVVALTAGLIDCGVGRERCRFIAAAGSGFPFHGGRDAERLPLP